MKIDRRRHYVLVVDTETANTQIVDGQLDSTNTLVYDCGWAVVDTKGNIYETSSYVNTDVFFDGLMASAYYIKKIPQYLEDIGKGRRVLADTMTIRRKMLTVMKKYEIKEVAAHNARFDYNSLNATLRAVTKSRYRYWFPFGTIFWDTMRMSTDVICKMPTYIKWCKEHKGCMLKNGKPRKTAEILYQFIMKDADFRERHTGLEDVLIEYQIMMYCYRQKKKMRKRLFDEDIYTPTDFQVALSVNLKKFPTVRMGT